MIASQALLRPRVLAANAIFIVYHLNLLHMKDVFRDGRFLALAGVLGVACTALYYGCGCSVWPPALLHGVLVWGWLCLFGGVKLFERQSD